MVTAWPGRRPITGATEVTWGGNIENEIAERPSTASAKTTGLILERVGDKMGMIIFK